MRLLIKADSHKRGEEREGAYAARAQVGTEKDGSPMYRYFETMEQYKNYMDKKGNKQGKKKPKQDDDKETLEERTAKEHASSTKKVREAQRRGKEKTLYVSKDKVNKSLFIWRDK